MRIFKMIVKRMAVVMTVVSIYALTQELLTDGNIFIFVNIILHSILLALLWISISGEKYE